MKKLKVVIVMLLAMMMSFALFACSDGNKQNEDPPAPSGKSIRSLYGAGSDTELTITDSDTQAEYEAKRNDLTLVWNTNVQGDRLNLKGSDHNFTGEVLFGTPGVYTVKASAKQNNPANVSTDITVTIVHDFEDVGGGVKVCRHDGVRQTTSQEDATIHYGNFHDAFSNTPAEVGSEPYTLGENSKIQPFGTVPMNGEQVEVETLTVGRLEPGTSITVRGSVKTMYTEWPNIENAAYYYAVIGVADRYYNAAEGYTGGTAVMVRPEGWVLYNGIGYDGMDRTLAGLIGSSDTADKTYPNYGSNETASDATNTPPAGWVKGQMPAPDSPDWHDWWVYSTGANLWTADLANDTPVELTWYYRNDGIMELTYNFRYASGNPTVSHIYIKVPQAVRGYYEAVLHGDYADVKVSEIVITEQNTVKNFRVEGIETTTYYEGQELDVASIKASVQYEQTGDAWNPISVGAGDVYATTDETVTEETVWVNLGDTPRLNAQYKNFKVQVVKSGKTFTQDLTGITIVPNAVAGAMGADATIENVLFENNKKLGSFSVAAQEGKIVLTLNEGASAIVQTLTQEQKTALGVTDETAYVALRLSGFTGLSTAFDTSEVTTTGATAKYVVDGDDVYAVFAFSQAADVTVSGLQTSDIVIKLAGLKGFGATASITGSAGKINTAGEVTVTYTLSGVAKEALTFRMGTTSYPYATIEQGLEAMGDAGVPFGASTITGLDSTTNTVTLTLKFAECSLNNVTAADLAYELSVLVNGAVETSDMLVRDFDGFAASEIKIGANAKTLTQNGYLVYVNSDMLYLAKTVNSRDLQSANLGTENLVLNLNAGGDLASFSLLDLGFAVEGGTIAFLSDALPKDACTIKLLTSGTIDNAADVDDGALIVIAVDITKLGVAAGGEYGFELDPQGGEPASYYWVSGVGAQRTINNKAVTATERVVLEEGSCLETGRVAYMIKNAENEVIFYMSVTEIGGAHSWHENVCELCGAKLEPSVSITDVNGSAGIKLSNGEYVSITGTYEDAMMNQDYNGIEMQIILENGTWVRIRNDGYYTLENNQGGATLLYNSNVNNTLNGVPNLIDGRPIVANADKSGSTSWLLVRQGATFHGTISLTDGIVTAYMDLYRKGETTPYITTTMKVEVEADSITAAFRRDIYQIGAGGIVGNKIERVVGKLAPSDITSVASEAVTTGKGTVAAVAGLTAATNGIYTIKPEAVEGAIITHGKVTANGAAAKMTADVRTALGIPAEDTKYTHYVSFAFNFKSALPASTIVSLKTLAGEAVAYSYAALNGERTKLYVVIPTDGATTKYLVDFVNQDASTIQDDFVLDLSNVAVSEIAGEVSVSGDITGGTATITYTGTIPADAQLSVNGESVTWASLNGYKFGSGVTAAVEGNVVTLTVAAADLSKVVPEYAVELLNAAGVLLALNTFDLLALPAQGILDNYYVVANGTKLTIVTTEETLVSGGTHGLSFLANSGSATAAADQAKALTTYEIGYTINGNRIAFAQSNLLTSKSTAVYSAAGNKAMVAITLDLAQIGIVADKAYCFQLGEAACKVAENAITAIEIPTTEKVAIVAQSCEKSGIKAVAIKEGDVVIGYLDVEVVMAHTWADQGAYFKCSVCGAILHADRNDARGTGNGVPSNGKLIDKADLKDVSKNGLSLSFWLNSAAADWDATPLASVKANLHVTIENVQGNVRASRPSYIPEEVWAKAGENLYPSLASAAPGLIVNAKGVYVTIVVDPGDQETDGVRHYVNGELTYNYKATLTGGTARIAELVTAFLLDAENSGLYVNGAKYAGALDSEKFILETKALTAEQVQARYENYMVENALYPTHVHSYAAETDKCVCGALKPEHEHAYAGADEANYDVCKCGMVNPKHGAAEGGTAHKYENSVCVVPGCGHIDPAHTCVDTTPADGKCDICDKVMESHVHDYTSGDKYGYCSCGETDPNHGEESGTAHVDNDGDAHCDADFCDIVMPNHVHSYSTTQGDGYATCICGETDPNHGNTEAGGTPHYDADENEYCDYCDVLMPDHEHSFANGICSVCATICEHEFAEGTCSACGAKQETVVDVTGASFDNIGDLGSSWFELPEGTKLSKGDMLTVHGTMTGELTQAWFSMIYEFKDGYTGRSDDFGWTFGAAKVNKKGNGVNEIRNAAGQLVAGVPWDNFKKIAKDSTWSMTFSWVRDTEIDVTITYVANSGELVGWTFTNKVVIELKDTTLTELALHFTAEQITNFTITKVDHVTYATQAPETTPPEEQA